MQSDVSLHQVISLYINAHDIETTPQRVYKSLSRESLAFKTSRAYRTIWERARYELDRLDLAVILAFLSASSTAMKIYCADAVESYEMSWTSIAS